MKQGKQSLLERATLWFMVQTRRISTRQLTFVVAIFIGLVAGGVTCIFEWLLEGIKGGLTSWFPRESTGWLYLVYPTIGIVLATLFVRHIVRDDISEGVTKVLKAMSTNSSKIKPHNCYSSVVGGALTIGFGGSVGPEAPIVLTGAAIGSNIGRLMKMNYRNLTLMLACGVAAALSGIFKAPITGVIFVLEILMLDLSMTALVPLIISSVSAVTLVFFVRGFEPMLTVDLSGVLRMSHIPLYTLLAVICGFMCYYFTSVNFRVKGLVDRLDKQWKKWLVGGFCIGLLILLFPPLYGEGYGMFHHFMKGDVQAVFDNSPFFRFRGISWVVVLYLVAIMFVKVVAMALTNASGGVGGTFAPSLFVGAFTGATVAYVCNTFFGTDLSIAAFSLVGMAGLMSGVMKAPLTAVFLIAEISSAYQLFVPLMLVSCVSYVIDHYLEPDSIYTKSLRKKGQLLTHDKDQAVGVVLSIRALVESDIIAVGEYDTLGDMVVRVIPHTKRNIFPVVAEDGHLLGVVEFDRLRKDMFDQTKYPNSVTRYMITPPDIVAVNESATSVLEKFETTGAWNLPVVDKENKYLGFISKSNILTAYREKLKEMTQE
ncbi:MAG: chloride channel protein [Tidjanibacter sp.]|nr:chloride channel protein [Tidjanibacter sp.]